ncbi:choice-of-anchor N protein [Thermodesulfobacteriota bacterium]
MEKLYLQAMKKLSLIAGLIISLLLFSVNAWAVPKLQLYIEGSAYDPVTETWVYPGLEYDLWAIGAMPDATGPEYIYDVKLAAAVRAEQTGTISITPYISEGVLAGSPIGGSSVAFYSDSTPVKSDGKKIPGHGIYPGDFWEYQLGDFYLDEQGIPDFTQGYDPDNPEPTDAWGKIAKYHVIVTGYDWVHFDLYDHIDGENHALFAPFSHDADAEDGGTPIPEPSSVLLLGTGLLFGLTRYRKKARLKKNEMNYPATELRGIKTIFYPINPDAEHRGILLINENSMSKMPA